MKRRLLVLLASVFIAWLCVPLLPGVPAFWFTLADYAGIAAVVTADDVVLPSGTDARPNDPATPESTR